MINRIPSPPFPLDMSGPETESMRLPVLPTHFSFHRSKPSWVTKALKDGQVFHEPGSGRLCQRVSQLAEPYVVAVVNADSRNDVR